MDFTNAENLLGFLAPFSTNLKKGHSEGHLLGKVFIAQAHKPIQDFSLPDQAKTNRAAV